MPSITKPWMAYNGRGWLLCLMCPMDKWTRRGGQYYRGIRVRKKTARQVSHWLRWHRHCGFEGIS